MLKDLPEMQVLNDFYFFDNTCWDCFLKKILYTNKFLALGVQILQNTSFIVHNLLNSIDPVFGQVVKLFHPIANWQEFFHRYLAVLASDDQLKLVIIHLLLNINNVFQANLILQLFKNS